MSIAIVGTGAIGGFLGVRLAVTGEPVTFIARGANLAAIKANGMKPHRGGRLRDPYPRDAGDVSRCRTPVCTTSCS